MSYCEIYALRRNGDIEQYGDARNAFGGAMHIWMVYAEQLGILPSASGKPEAARDIALGRLLHGGMDDVWKRYDELPEPDQWVMRSTFDRVLIGKAALPTYLGHLRAFAERHPSETLREIIAILDRAALDSAVCGVAFNHTSVVHGTWLVPVESADDEEVEDRPYNIKRDQGHWWIDGVAG